MATTGNRGKFSDRIKKITFIKKKKNLFYEVEDSNKIYTNFLKVVAALPGVIYDNAIYHEEDKKKIRTKVNSSEVLLGDDTTSLTNTNSLNIAVNQDMENNFSVESKNQDYELSNADGRSSKEKARKIVSGIDIFSIKKSQDIFYKTRGVNVTDSLPEMSSAASVKTDNNSQKVKELEKSIINIIKKKLIKTVNEMEILQSELYILSEVNGESKALKDCQRELDQVKSMLCKIDKLKEKYDFLRDNQDFEYLLEIDDSNLIDKIIELKDTFGNNQVKALVHDYKLLDVYKFLYLKLDDLQDKTAEFEEKKQEELMKLKQRDIDFEQLKRDAYNVEDANKQYTSFVRNQSELLAQIDEAVSKIDKGEEVSYHLKGFNELFRSSFKYFALLMMSPLKGIIPSIATETLVTRNLINNLYKNLEWEEEKRIVYSAMDYSSLINSAIQDLDSTSRIVDTTLDDIVRLKMRYNDRFREYQGDFLEYQDVMRKINDMENKIMGNKLKVEIMRKRALDQKRANEKKLVLVRKLNSEQTSKKAA